ncbi:MAG: CoA-binding protein [Flavobacteriaceae bacterium]|nr:CoA-binding protein [Flavobacteriaceae bacterium]
MCKKTLVLGASVRPDRYSNIALWRLSANNQEVVAIGRFSGEVAGVIIETGKPLYENVDTICLYLSPRHQEEYYQYILSLNVRRVIFNPGTENLELVALLKENNIEAELACTLVLLSTGQY